MVMFLKLAHTKLDAYTYSHHLVVECYKITKSFPSDERFGMMHQIRRAAVSVHLNLAEGASRKSPLERKRFFEISRGSVIEIDSAIDIALSLNYTSNEELKKLEFLIITTFKLLSGMIEIRDQK